MPQISVFFAFMSVWAYFQCPSRQLTTLPQSSFPAFMELQSQPKMSNQDILGSFLGMCIAFQISRNMLQLFEIPQRHLRRRQWHPTTVLLPGKSHGRRSLVDYSPWGREESDMTERIHFHFSLSCIGEGNGNPLQCSCLENPRDRGTWWAAIYSVAQNWTLLK